MPESMDIKISDNFFLSLNFSELARISSLPLGLKPVPQTSNLLSLTKFFHPDFKSASGRLEIHPCVLQVIGPSGLPPCSHSTTSLDHSKQGIGYCWPCVILGWLVYHCFCLPVWHLNNRVCGLGDHTGYSNSVRVSWGSDKKRIIQAFAHRNR